MFTANNVTASFAQTSAVVAAAPGSTQASNPASAPAAASSPPLPSNSAAASTTTAAPTTTVAATPTVVTGGSFANRFGAVQVQATFAPDGSLADVAVLQAPDGDRRSARISEIVVPMLNNEALTVQSGSVDTVSGATYTSRSYEQSLQSAIDAARAQGITSIA